MRCQRCGRPVSPLRQLTDREFCCDEHRRRGRLASASVLRDLEHDQDPFWEALHGQAQQKSNARANTSLGAVLVLGVGLIVAARFWFPEEVASAPAVAQIIDTAPKIGSTAERGTGRVMRWMNEHLPGDRPVILRDDFSSGLANWASSAGSARTGQWQSRDGSVQPGQLRIWKPTLRSVNYEVEFEGSVDRKALSWAFRAANPENYYATKLILRKSGEMSGAALQRIIVSNSRITNLGPEMPLPIKIERGKHYQIALSVEGNRFTTLIGGSKVDEWTDRQARHQSGGVGFYSDEGEAATISWVRFTEHKGVFSRLFAANIFLAPGFAPDFEE